MGFIRHFRALMWKNAVSFSFLLDINELLLLVFGVGVL
jgi:hypothetical protein